MWQSHVWHSSVPFVSSMNPKEEKRGERRKRQDMSLFYRLSTRSQTKSQLRLTRLYFPEPDHNRVLCPLYGSCHLVPLQFDFQGLMYSRFVCVTLRVTATVLWWFIIMISAASDENPSFDLICDKHTIAHQPHVWVWTHPLWVWTHPLGQIQLLLLWMSYDFNFLSFSIQDSSAHQNSLKKRR